MLKLFLAQPTLLSWRLAGCHPLDPMAPEALLPTIEDTFLDPDGQSGISPRVSIPPDQQECPDSAENGQVVLFQCDVIAGLQLSD